MTTDDPQEAFSYLLEKRRAGEKWDMAEVRHMTNPPRTVHKWCVFPVEENKDEAED